MLGRGSGRFGPRWSKGLALGAVSLVGIVALRWAAQPMMGAQGVLLFFAVPVLVAAYYGGLVPGLVVTAVSGVVGVGMFVLPYQAEVAVEVWRLGMFMALGALISVLTEELHCASARAERVAEGLRESEERVRLLVDGTRDSAVFGLDEAGRVSWWNAGAERLTGYGEEEVVGEDVAVVGMPREVLEVAREEGVTRVAGEYARKGGETFRVEVTVTAVGDVGGGVRGFAVVAHDVTERWRSEREIQDHLARTRGILDAAGDAIVTFDGKGVVESANPAAERVFGWPVGELVGRDVRMVLELEGPGEMSADVVRARLVAGRETTGRRRDGGRFPAEVSVGEMELAGRRLCAVVVHDITRRKRAEEEIRQLNDGLERRVAERTRQVEEINEELKAFSYTVSHDLRTPLRGIQRFAQIILSEDPGVSAEMKEEAGRRVMALSARMERLVEDVLEQSRLARRDVVPQRVSLILVVQEVLGQLAREPEYACARVTVQEPLPVVLGNRAMLLRVMSNLLTNAIRFVPGGREARVRVWTEDRGEMVRVWVEDNGVGIEEERREGIFEPFGREDAEERGACGGVGLAVARKGVERMGGRLGLESEVGRGSRFWVELRKG